MSAKAAETEKSEANDTEQPAVKRTTAKKKAAVKRSPAKKSAKKEKTTSKNSAEELADTMKDLITVQLGVYGTISDEVNARLEKIRAETPKKWRKLEKRGKKIQRDLDKAQEDLKQAFITDKVGDYQMISIPHEEIDSHLVIGSDETETPENLQGLWWMDGNPLADEVLSFSGVTFKEIIVDGEVVGHEGLLPVYDEAVWSWHNSLQGKGLYSFVNKSKLVYLARFNKDFTFGKIIPTFKPIGFLPPVGIKEALVDFEMTQINADEWSRDSQALGMQQAKSQYRFRRIVAGNGQRLGNWDDYIESLEERSVPNALLPIGTLDD